MVVVLKQAARLVANIERGEAAEVLQAWLVLRHAHRSHAQAAKVDCALVKRLVSFSEVLVLLQALPNVAVVCHCG